MATAEGYDPAVWRQMSEELALPGIHIPEQYGGAGFGMVELGIVMEEFGRALVCAHRIFPPRCSPRTRS